MNWKRIVVFILVLPIIIIPIFVGGMGLLLVFGIQYAITGKYNQDDGGW